jgi:hypothetical protein
MNEKNKEPAANSQEKIVDEKKIADQATFEKNNDLSFKDKTKRKLDEQLTTKQQIVNELSIIPTKETTAVKKVAQVLKKSSVLKKKYYLRRKL